MTCRFRIALGSLALLSLAATGSSLRAAGPEAPASAAYQQEMEKWRQELEASLRKEDGWLTLVGLFWLDPGENRFGSDPGNKVILPEGKAPAVAGTLIRKGEDVSIRVAPGVSITSGGKPVTSQPLTRDAGGKPTLLELGTLQFHVIQRGQRIGVRIKDTKSPALAAFHGLDWYPVQPSWRVVARFEPYTPVKQVPIPNVLGDVQDNPSPGAVVFDWQGKTYRLDALGESAEEGLFVIFADQTNGKQTYGAGRFLETGPPKDGHVVIDFNQAYNPPCAYTAFATCPLPPAQNKLALGVEAGEKKFAGGPAH